MSDQYDFTWSLVNKAGFTVQPQTKNTTSTSLVLTGRGSPNWGRDLQQNLIKLLEHFASPTPPANGVTGQLWYDTTNKILHVFDASVDASNAWAGTAGGGITADDTAPGNPKNGTLWYDTVNAALMLWNGTKWNQIYPMLNTTAAKVAFVTEYNAFVVTINKVIGTAQGTTLATAFGYGQTDIFTTETIYTLTNAKWVLLLTKLIDVCKFLGQDYSGISTDGFIYETGNVIPYGSVTMLAKYTSTLTAANNLLAGTVRFTPATVSLESSVPAAGTTSRSTTWSGTITHEVLCAFADTKSLNAYVNAGGQFQFFSSEMNAGTLRDFQWMDFLGKIGTVKFSATGSIDSLSRVNTKGFYDLTTSYQVIYTLVNTANTAQVFTINAKIDSAKTLHFQLVYSDPGTLYGGVGGTLNSATTLVRANQTVLKAPVLAYPTVTQTSLV